VIADISIARQYHRLSKDWWEPDFQLLACPDRASPNGAVRCGSQKRKQRPLASAQDMALVQSWSRRIRLLEARDRILEAQAAVLQLLRAQRPRRRARRPFQTR
jgi:hypothetical protein